MVYKAFQETITSRLQDRLGADCRLDIRKVPKNNGIFLDGLTITPEGETVAPVIYLNHYYEHFLAGSSIDALIEEIVTLYQQRQGAFSLNFDLFNDFSRLKAKVAYRLVNTDANRSLLEDLVSFPFQDLSIVFYLILEDNSLGQMTAAIQKRHLQSWNIKDEELLHLAQKNTPHLLPPKLQNMTQVMDEIAKETMGDDYDPGIIDRIIPGHQESPLYVLSNTSGLNGACTMLYPNVLKNFSGLLGRDLIILPSSIHEVLLVPYEENVEFHELEEMVTTINQTEVAFEDQLSNHVYFYSHTADAIILAHAPASAYIS